MRVQSGCNAALAASGTIATLTVSKQCMDVDRLHGLFAAPLASLFLILSLCAFVLQRPVSMGMHVPIPQVRTVPIEDCHADRYIAVQIQKDASTKIGETSVSLDELHTQLGDIYANRKEKLLLLVADPEIPYGDFAAIYNLIKKSTTDLTIELFTPRLRTGVLCPPGSGNTGNDCGFYWPDHKLLVSCGGPLPPMRLPLRRLRRD